jgi:hypothetical protein
VPSGHIPKRARTGRYSLHNELLAGCGRDSGTQALMLAHGFTVALMVELVRAGWRARPERMMATSRLRWRGCASQGGAADASRAQPLIS